MKKLFLKIVLFLLPGMLFLWICIALPATPKVNKSLLFAKIKKDSLLVNVPNPRIIFIGGSNLSFGLNSQLIKNALKINPINTGITASTGLIFMMENTLQFIQKGDLVVLVPEYSQFYNDFAIGNEELYRTILDVKFSDILSFNYQQFKDFVCFVPRYAMTKLNSEEYGEFPENKIYSVNSFNSYGDAYKHWDSTKEKFEPYGLEGDLDMNVIEKMENFKNKVEDKGGILFVSYPGYEMNSFNIGFGSIKTIEEEYKNKGFKLLGTPERYAMPDSLTYNTPYHLIKKGLDYRTQLLIEDLKNALK